MSLAEPMSDQDRPEPRLEAFYDGACPLCAREIAFYRNRIGADEVRWVDIAADPDPGLPEGLTKDAAMARFHVRTADGTVLSGAAAFLALWRRLDRFTRLGAVLSHPLSLPVLEAGYRSFLKARPFLQPWFTSPAAKAPKT